MDFLERFIIERIGCRFHPYLSKHARWRHYPGHVAALLKDLNPLHAVSVTDKFVVVDGICIADARPMREKYSLAVEAISVIFGEADERVAISGNCEASIHPAAVVSISLYWGSVWYLVPSTPFSLPRFAYVTDSNDNLFAYEKAHDGDYVKGVVLVGEKPRAEVRCSKRFFTDPRLENVELFGDLCFLTQMREKWQVCKTVDLRVSALGGEYWLDSASTLGYVAKVLRECIGWKLSLIHI